MGLFFNKRKSKQQSTAKVKQAADSMFDDQYREELRQIGRDHFKELISSSAADVKQEFRTAVNQSVGELREYMAKQLDVTIANVNTEIVNQLNERLKEYNRITSEAQDQAAQSLNRSAKEMHEKYQQLASALQQVISSQEVMMISVFQENKTRVAATQDAQGKMLQSITDGAEKSRQQSAELFEKMKKNIEDQSSILSEIYNENIIRVSAVRDTQNASIEALKQTTEALNGQYQQLRDLLDKSISDQKNMMVSVINDNLAYIVEHYLVGALGEQTDLKAQLPSILKRLEENKQNMMDDMKL